MELPISTIVVFFIAIAVAVLVIGFATDMFSKSKKDLEENPLIEKEEDEDVLLELSSISAQQVVSLAKKCKEQTIGKELNSKTCYVLHGTVATTTEQIKSHLNDEENYMVNLGDVGRTVYIKYNSIKNIVEVTG